MRPSGPGVVVPMDMLRDITESGVVGDATRARKQTGERIVAAMIPRIVQVAREMAGRAQEPMRRIIALTQPLSKQSQLHPFFPNVQILRHMLHADAPPDKKS